MFILRGIAKVAVPDAPIKTLVQIVRVTILINLLMLVSEVFTHFYTGGSHADSSYYLFFGLHGKSGLVPWIWTAIVLNIVSAVLFLLPAAMRNMWVVIAACAAAFLGIWIEKGMGLIIPGFIPSTLHEIVEYQPSLVEWKVTAGVWAFGLMIYTIALKVAIPILSGRAAGETPAAV